MLAQYAYTKGYLFTALEAAPALYARALKGLTPEEADRRPDPARFTIREVMAHQAEWEEVFLMRMKRICAEETPLLEGYDEGQWAIDHDYAHTDPFEQLRLYGERRATLVAFLRPRSDSDWERPGNRPEIGLITLEGMAMLVALHDTYHLQQIFAWRE